MPGGCAQCVHAHCSLGPMAAVSAIHLCISVHAFATVTTPSATVTLPHCDSVTLQLGAASAGSVAAVYAFNGLMPRISHRFPRSAALQYAIGVSQEINCTGTTHSTARHEWRESESGEPELSFYSIQSWRAR